MVGLSVASFSLIEDDLSQWRAYGGGSGGFCVGFEPGELEIRIRRDAFAATIEETTASGPGAVARANTFAPSRLAAMNRTKQGENVFISPLSASMALGMAMNGGVRQHV